MGTNLLEILEKAKAVRDDIKAGEFVKAWEDTLPIQQAMCDLAHSVGFKSAPGDEATAKEIQSTLEEARDLAMTSQPKAGAAGPVGKIGDGVILGKLLDFLVKIAPIVIPLIV